MKITIFNTLYYPDKIGGAEVSVQDIAEGLVGLGHSVSVVALSGSESSSYSINGVKVFKMKLANVFWPYSRHENRVKSRIDKIFWHVVDYFNIFMFFKVLRLLRDTSPDLIHSNNIQGFSFSVWMAAYYLKIPIVHTVRDYYLIGPSGKVSTYSYVIHMAMLLLMYPKILCSRLVGHVVYISDYVKVSHQKFGYFKRCPKSVVYNSVNFQESNVNYISPKEKKNLVVGYIGRVSYEKGFDIFCEYSRNSSTTKIRYIAAGESDLEYSYEANRLATESGVDMLGYVSSEEFYKLIDVLLVPARWDEPFGRTVIEALAMGKIVFVSGRGGLGELRELCDGVYDLSEYSPARFFLDGYVNDYKCMSLFSRDHIVSQYESIYEGVLQ